MRYASGCARDRFIPGYAEVGRWIAGRCQRCRFILASVPACAGECLACGMRGLPSASVRFIPARAGWGRHHGLLRCYPLTKVCCARLGAFAAGRIAEPRAGSVAAFAVQRRIGRAYSCVSGRSSAARGPGTSSGGRWLKRCGFISSAFLSLACRQSCRPCRVYRRGRMVRHAPRRMPDGRGGLRSIACVRLGGRDADRLAL